MSTGWASGEEEGRGQGCLKGVEEEAEHSFHQQKVWEAREEHAQEERAALALESLARCSQGEGEQEELWEAEEEEQEEQGEQEEQEVSGRDEKELVGQGERRVHARGWEAVQAERA